MYIYTLISQIIITRLSPVTQLNALLEIIILETFWLTKFTIYATLLLTSYLKTRPLARVYATIQ